MSIDPNRLDLLNLTVSDLLFAHGAILDELRRREIVRSFNNPLSDYAELLFCKAFGWARENNSATGHDAVDRAGIRYQVKGRRLTKHNASREMSAIRNLDKAPFDQLAGVLVDGGFKVVRAALVPVAHVRAKPLPGGGVSCSSPVAIRVTFTAAPITSAGRCSPRGPFGMATPPPT